MKISKSANLFKFFDIDTRKLLSDIASNLRPI